MSLNLNYTNIPDYSLQGMLTDELIDIFGVPCKYIKTDKIELDRHGFGEWQALKAEEGDVFEVNMLPENSDEFDGQDQLYDTFGLSNFNQINLFISRPKIEELFPEFDQSVGFNQMVSDLIVLPSNKVLEIIKVEPMVPGINNLYSYPDTKNVYKVYCTRYMFKQNDELQSAFNKANDMNIVTNEDGDIVFDSRTQESLDDYFTKLLNNPDITDIDDKNGIDKEIVPEITSSLGISDTFTINNVQINDTGLESAHPVPDNYSVTQSSIKSKQDKATDDILYKRKSKLGDLW